MRSDNPAAGELLELVRWQLSLGVRVPGTPGNLALRHALEERIRRAGASCVTQPFTVSLGGRTVECANVVACLGHSRGREPPLLVGTHWDTRAIADRDPDPGRRGFPIPGANDGGSGTAVLLGLLAALSGRSLPRPLQVVFFDAEDVGNIEGNSFSMGARFMAENPVDLPPAKVVVLDMVGGRGMVLDRDAHAAGHPGTLELTRELFGIGAGLDLAPFTASKSDQWKYVICDHTPFLRRGIPSALLIDLDYPPWHTHGDLPEAMEEASLAATAGVVATYVERYMAGTRR